MKIFLLVSLFLLASCGTVSTNFDSTSSDNVLKVSEPTISEEKIVWNDLRIQQLMPGYMVRPAIEPVLPDDFIALPHPNKKMFGALYWGKKETLEEFFRNYNLDQITSPILYVNISSGVAQNKDDTFTGEATAYDECIADGCLDVRIDKLKWGDHPVLSMNFIKDGKKEYLAFVGLNHQGEVLLIKFCDVTNQNISQGETSRIWTDFLTKSRPLGERDFYKLHGQDVRKGFTLVNVDGSVLKVSAEKRTRDGKIQVSIKPADDTISCKCFGVEQMLMPAKLHFLEPIVKIQTEIQVINTANIVAQHTITVLLKEVSEFSTNEMNTSGVSKEQFNRISVLNFCDTDVVNPELPTVYNNLLP